MRSTTQQASQLKLWLMVGALGLTSASLLGIGLLRPRPVQNLADPMPLAAREHARILIPESIPSASRQLAQVKNDARAESCENRFHDCELACRHYPKGSTPNDECMVFCTRSRESCMSWAHR